MRTGGLVHGRAGLALRLLCALALLLTTRAVWAADLCSSASDCDADGTANELDDCPASLTGETPDSSIRHGFRDVACYRRVTDPIAELLPCDVVAVRPFDEDVPTSLGGGPTQHRRGFTWVGVLKSSAVPNPSPRLQELLSAMANPSAVTASFRDTAPDAEPLPNALFACVGSVELMPSGFGDFVGKFAFGYRIAAAYVRATVDAAHAASKLGYPKSDAKRFSDGLGLLTNICAAPAASGTCFARGLFGTNGAWLDSGMDWADDPALLTSPGDDALPHSLTKIYDAACFAEKLKVILQLSLEAAKKTIPVNPGPGPDPTAWKELATPFGPTPVQFQGPMYSPSSGAKPLAANNAEYLGSGPIATIEWLPYIYTPKSDCSVTTDVPNFVFDKPKLPGEPASKPVVGTASPSKKKLSGFSEFLGSAGMHDPRAVVVGVVDFFSTHAHATNLAFDPQLSWSLLLPRPDRPPPFRSARSDSALLVSQEAPLSSYAVVESGSALWGVLGALGWQDVHPFAVPWTHDSGGQRTLGIYNLGKQIAKQDFDYGAGTWKTELKQYSGQPDYAEVTAPVAWFSTDGKGLSQARVSVHLAADKWHPAGDYWLTNAATKRCENLSDKLGPGFPLNSAYAIEESWCRDPSIVDIPELKSFENRVDSCDIDHYDPGIGDKHWLPLRNRAPFAALWGNLKSGEMPKAKFPSGDLLRAGVARTNILHEGLDINWVFKKEHLERQDVLGTIPGKVCWSELALAGVQIALSCSDPAFAVCGSLAQNACCNPLERYWEEYKSEIEDACSCASPPSCDWYDVICDVEAIGSIFECGLQELFVCAPTIVVGGVNFVAQTAVAYASLGCVLVTGKPDCSDAGFSVCSGTPTNAGEIENELEYNIAYGARVNKTGWGPGFTYPGNCEPTNLPCECTWGPPIGKLSYLPNNFVWNGNTPLVALDDNAKLTGKKGKPDSKDPLTWLEPFTVGPGIFHERQALWGSVAKRAGTSGIEVESTPILSSEMRATGQSLSTAQGDYAFRLEMLGDLIVDCGHLPFRTEIHPPVAIALHLAGKASTRYSLFGWHRKSLDTGPVVIDLWPATPRPSSAAKLQSKVVFDAGFGSGPGRWSCAPHPTDMPTRVRCELKAGSADGGSGCDENPRMRPACATDVAGGIAEVFWQ